MIEINFWGWDQDKGLRIGNWYLGFGLNTGFQTRIWDWKWELDLQIWIRYCDLGLGETFEMGIDDLGC